MILLAILGVLFIALMFSFWTTNEGKNWDEKMESLDKKIHSQKTVQKTLSGISLSCYEIVNKLGEYYAWVEEVSREHIFLPQEILEENEHRQIELTAPLFACKHNFLEELKQAFYSNAFSDKVVIDNAACWNSNWKKSYEEAVSLKAVSIKFHLETHKEEILSLVTITTHEIQLLLNHEFTAADNAVKTEDITKMMNLLSELNKKQ